MSDKNALRRALKEKGYWNGSQSIWTHSQLERTPYKATVLGEEYIVHPKVFSPKYFDDSEFFAAALVKSHTRKSFLEIGTGTGVIAISLAKSGTKKVVAVDLSPEAVVNARENVRLHRLTNKVSVRTSDVYSGVHTNERFDVIFWNVPWGYVDREVSVTERSLHDPFYTSIKRAVLESPNHLTESGVLCLGFSTKFGRLDLIKEYAKEIGKSVELIAKRKATEANPVSIELLQIS